METEDGESGSNKEGRMSGGPLVVVDVVEDKDEEDKVEGDDEEGETETDEDAGVDEEERNLVDNDGGEVD